MLSTYFDLFDLTNDALNIFWFIWFNYFDLFDLTNDALNIF